MNIVLLEPEIPQNTANIGRTCVGTNTKLHLIKPLGFSLDEKSVRRSAASYWDMVDLTIHENFEEFCLKENPKRIIMSTTKSHKNYTEIDYNIDDYIMFGKESAGIPEEILVDYEETSVRIPMTPDFRSLNLSNAVNIILFEALRQNSFPQLDKSGDLHRLSWNKEK